MRFYNYNGVTHYIVYKRNPPDSNGKIILPATGDFSNLGTLQIFAQIQQDFWNIKNNKKETTKVILLKYFSINTTTFDDRDIKFRELTKNLYLFCYNLEQFTLLNVKLFIKGNQDQSSYVEPLNYPINKINHNNLEIISSSEKRKIIIIVLATVILNSQDINILLPLMDVSCEYLSKKKKYVKTMIIIWFNLIFIFTQFFPEKIIIEYSALIIPFFYNQYSVEVSSDESFSVNISANWALYKKQKLRLFIFKINFIKIIANLRKQEIMKFQ